MPTKMGIGKESIESATSDQNKINKTLITKDIYDQWEEVKGKKANQNISVAKTKIITENR